MDRSEYQLAADARAAHVAGRSRGSTEQMPGAAVVAERQPLSALALTPQHIQGASWLGQAVPHRPFGGGQPFEVANRKRGRVARPERSESDGIAACCRTYEPAQFANYNWSILYLGKVRGYIYQVLAKWSTTCKQLRRIPWPSVLQ